ncbi:hypothetical protein ACFP81_04060 [Deinococcus lacus]|uniref:FAD dependent oxidoreductase domain-containing protein n=1 Tax=Deinococcus lacus TaxID=392561 RepID=A0ABW1YAS7_9DEIO
MKECPVTVPLSFGAYLCPANQPQARGVLGATFEAPEPKWRTPPFPPTSLEWLLDKGAALASLRGLQVTGHWSGTRLSGLRAGRQPQGHWELSGLGSKGFLLGPLLARHLVGELLGAKAKEG